MQRGNELIATLDDERAAYRWAEDLIVRQRNLVAHRPDADQLSFEVREVADANVERVEKELAKLTKVCLKYKQLPPVIWFSPTRFVVTTRRPERDPETGDVYERVIRRLCRTMVVVSPTYVGQDGWTLDAKVTHIGGEAIIATFPGRTVPEFTQFRQNLCEHCGTRRQRNETIIVSRPIENGRTYRVLGKDCLREYTGIDPVHALAVAGFYEATGQANATDRYEEPLDDYLAWVARRVRLDGRYWSKAKAEDENSRRFELAGGYGNIRYTEVRPTSQQADNDEFAAEQNTRTNSHRNPEDYPTEADLAMVQAVKAWALTLDPRRSTYEANLLALFRADALVWGLKGLAASAFAGYAREQAAVERARQQATKPASQYLGNAGDKVDLPRVKVVAVREFDGTFGPTWIYRFETPEGNVATWFSSNDCDLEVGQTHRVRGTIKKLEVFNNQHQTVLTRCRILPAA